MSNNSGDDDAATTVVAGDDVATTVVAGAETRGPCVEILFCNAMGRAPTPPTAVNFFFEGIRPVLFDDMFVNNWCLYYQNN